MLIVFGVLTVVSLLFISNWVRGDIVAIASLLTLMLSGVLTVEESLAGFGQPVIIIIVAMFIVSEALVNTGIAQRIGEMVLKAGRNEETRLIILLMAAVMGVGAFMNSTAAVAIFIPITLSVSDKAGLNRKRILMPLCIGALTSGMTTLVATAPNLIVVNALKARGIEPLGFFSFMPFGMIVLVVGIIFMLAVGRRMLAKEKHVASAARGRTAYQLAESYGLAGRLKNIRVLPDSPLADHTVARIQMRQNYGIHIIAFDKWRAGKRYYLQAAPGTVFESGDRIMVIGDAEQIDLMAKDCKLAIESLPIPHVPAKKRKKFLQEIGLAEIMLVPESKLIGKTLREINFQRHYKTTVLAVRHRGQSFADDLGDRPLDFGDALLVNGAWSNILKLHDEKENFVVLTLPQEFRDLVAAPKRASQTLAILGAMVAAMASGVLPTVTAAMLAAIFLIAFRCVKLTSVYQVINWQAVVLIGGILPLATALNKSGASQLISHAMVSTLGYLGPTAMLAVIFIITAVTGSFISNTPAAIIIAPIAINAALELGVSPHAFAMTVAIACSAAYATPVSSAVNMLVMEPGEYTFTDFAKVGLPLLFLTLIVTVVMARILYIY